MLIVFMSYLVHVFDLLAMLCIDVTIFGNHVIFAGNYKMF